MTGDRDADLERVCQEALERPVAERADFLLSACAGDEGLRREAEALLALVGTAGSFLATPAVEIAARELGTADPALIASQPFGPYTIVARLGAGGMGEVYRARDHTLRRDVAIKVLPTLFTSDAERLARFEQEARLLASLNHPNIATIHGVEHVDGIHALVLELVEGQTLAERLQSAVSQHRANAGLPLADALTIARQVAEALEAAHEQGVVHRDLKPANTCNHRQNAFSALIQVLQVTGLTPRSRRWTTKCWRSALLISGAAGARSGAVFCAVVNDFQAHSYHSRVAGVMLWM